MVKLNENVRIHNGEIPRRRRIVNKQLPQLRNHCL